MFPELAEFLNALTDAVTAIGVAVPSAQPEITRLQDARATVMHLAMPGLELKPPQTEYPGSPGTAAGRGGGAAEVPGV